MSTIKNIELQAFEYVMPSTRAYGQARGLNFRRTFALIVVTTPGGIIGYGEAGGPLKPLRDYLEMFKPMFVGRSMYDFEIVATEIGNRFYHFGHQGHATACLSGISIALVDAIGKTLGVSAHNFLGGRSADKFQCYATTGYFTNDDVNDFEPQLEAAKGKFPGVKIKIGKSPASDYERVKLAREILGDDILLMVDVNGNYTADIAYQSIRKIEPFNIHWYEEPLPPTDLRGYADLHARSPIPLAAGEAFYTVHDFQRMVEARALDILQPSIASCGGFGQAKAIAQLAQANNLRLSPSVWGNAIAIMASLHFAASLPAWPHTDNAPYPMIIELDVGENPLREGLLRLPLRLDRGALVVPNGPGLGVMLNEAALREYAVRAA
jgi:D-galactarolactone cycloisomerase